MFPDEDLVPNSSDITYSQFKSDLKKKNFEHKTSTLNVDTQELSNAITQVGTTGKQLCTRNMQNKCSNGFTHNKHTPKQYTPKSISYIKRILETSKRMMYIDTSDDEDDIICVFDSSETRSGLDENVKEADEHENSSRRHVIQQNKNLHVKNCMPYPSSSNTSVISNSSRSNENKTYNNKRSASNEIGFVKRRSSRLKVSKNNVGDHLENGEVNKIQDQTICTTVNGEESVRESGICKPLQGNNNLQTNKNLKNV